MPVEFKIIVNAPDRHIRVVFKEDIFFPISYLDKLQTLYDNFLFKILRKETLHLVRNHINEFFLELERNGHLYKQHQIGQRMAQIKKDEDYNYLSEGYN